MPMEKCLFVFVPIEVTIGMGGSGATHEAPQPLVGVIGLHSLEFYLIQIYWTEVGNPNICT